MPLDEVAEEIRDEAEAEAQSIVEEAEAEAERILQSARQEADEIEAARREDLEEEVEALRQQELASARLEAKKERLNAERDILDRVREAVEDRIRNLPTAERKRHIQALVKGAGVSDGAVRVAERDEEIAEELDLEVDGTFEGLGGVEVVAPDGSFTENLRYENILDEVWRDSRQDVADELIPDT